MTGTERTPTDGARHRACFLPVSKKNGPKTGRRRLGEWSRVRVSAGRRAASGTCESRRPDRLTGRHSCRGINVGQGHGDVEDARNACQALARSGFLLDLRLLLHSTHHLSRGATQDYAAVSLKVNDHLLHGRL